MNNMWHDRADGDMYRKLGRANFETVTIQRIRETIMRHVSYEPYMGNFEVFMEREVHMMADAYVMGIVRRVPAREFEKTVTFQVPETWWQHFKESHFPKWALEKFPVKYKTLTEIIGFKALYEHLNMIPGNDPVIQVRVGKYEWE